MAKFLIKLLSQICITLIINNILHTFISHELRLPLSLILPDILFPLLINGLLVQHVVRAILVAGTHQPRSVINLG